MERLCISPSSTPYKNSKVPEEKEKSSPGSRNDRQLTLLDFVYVPLENPTEEQKRGTPDSEVRWTVLNLHKEQWRPFSFGTLPNRKTHDDGEEDQEQYQAEQMQWATATTTDMRNKGGEHTLQSDDCVRLSSHGIRHHIRIAALASD
ncbi:hypothetical protein OPV22_032011 [Ensete ventricosum]|uniref:Uncharacterized protein n=1 Tax=Ensete ventricosum TaxID=4639 RepID=A0AAV8P0Y4_ENSVE|nr:hypothetical protein OPV22_032011 [Ensete ventricosum]